MDSNTHRSNLAEDSEMLLYSYQRFSGYCWKLSMYYYYMSGDYDDKATRLMMKLVMVNAS